MTFLEYMRRNYPNANNNDAASVWLACKGAQEYADLQVRLCIQSIIDYEHENGREPICNDEERSAADYAAIFNGKASEGNAPDDSSNEHPKYCTIVDSDDRQYLAKAEYRENYKAVGPAMVEFKGEWISIQEFEGLGYNNYGCVNYRMHP